MQIKTKKTLLLSALVIVLIIAIGAFYYSNKKKHKNVPSDAGTVETKGDSEEEQYDVVNNVKISDAKILKKENGNFEIAFDILGKQGYQSDVKYAVNLAKKDEANNRQVIVDQKIYEETLSLNEGEKLHKDISYMAPNYLSGEFGIYIEVRNASGFRYDMASLDGVIDLKGDGKYLNINSDVCKLFVQNDEEKEGYAISQNIDIAKEETLAVKCMLENPLLKGMMLTPVIETHVGSMFGKVISSEKKDSFKLGDKADEFVVDLPHGDVSQRYAAKLTFVDGQNQQVSIPLEIDYVVGGKAVNIFNVVSEKKDYQKGDNARFILFWTGLRNLSMGVRGKLESNEGLKADISIYNNKKEKCAQDFSKDLFSEKDWAVEIVASDIEIDCPAPRMEITILNKEGNVLAKNEYVF